MENLSSIISNQTAQIKKLEDFIELFQRREKVMPKIKSLDNKTNDVQEIISKCNAMITSYEDDIVKECDLVIAKMRSQQLKILEVLEVIEKRELSVDLLPKIECKTPVRIAESSSVRRPKTTPQMYLSDYIQSPYISRRGPISLQFLDFHVNFTDEQFKGIPDCTRGRETATDLRCFLENIILPCFTEKYQLLYRKRDCIKNPNDIEIWKMYKDQMSYFPGKKFITDGDITRKTGKLLNRQNRAWISMLRNLKIIHQEQYKTTICYIWLAN